MKERLLSKIKAIESLDPLWREKARQRLSEQTRPQGSLGVLENFVERIVAIQRSEKPSVGKKRILVFAADHGVTEDGVSLYPKNVTRAMVLNFLNGGATINALARHIGAEVQVIDVGVDGDFKQESNLIRRSLSSYRVSVVSSPKSFIGDPFWTMDSRFRGNDKPLTNLLNSVLIHAKVAKGTKRFTKEKAMSEEQFWQAFSTGWQAVERASEDGIELLGLGEMGIGNTTAASAVIAAVTGWKADLVAGRGTGLNEVQRKHKARIIQKALNLHQNQFKNTCSILQCVGGFEIAALTGAILGGAVFRIPMVVDGWIVSTAAFCAQRINTKVLDYLFFAHQSEEQAHRRLLEHLEVRPILNLSMRLGEASGAALAMGILEAAIRVYLETATFDQAGVSQRDK